MSVSPYVVGQWVRGERFYGRSELIEEILHGNRNWLWLLGTRRIGKTSLLKQIEQSAANSIEQPFFPLFWDFQGATDGKGLHGTFRDSLEDASAYGRLDEFGFSIEDVEDDDLFRSIGQLRRRLHSSGKKLLLLCDEVEELMRLNEVDPDLLRRLRRSMQSQEDIRSVLASTTRLWALSDGRVDTSPFLHGFTPPLYIHNLEDDEARSLLRQTHLPSDARPEITDDVVESIRGRCDNHPYLLQLLGKRYQEVGDLDEAAEQVAADPMLSCFFSVDFDMLSETEQDVLRTISEHRTSDSNSILQAVPVDPNSLTGHLHRLQHLGYIRRNPEGLLVLVNRFFSRWLKELPSGAARLDPETKTLTLGKFDDRYELLEKIGDGATGVVFKTYDDLLRVNVALKLLHREYVEHEEAAERLRREVLLTRELSHPNIVKMFDLSSFGNRKYLTMEWVDGVSLKALLVQGPVFPIPRVLSIATKLASALEVAHEHRVLHRDIKPQNILMSADDEPHVVDFGLARLVDDSGVTTDGVFLGTPDYASPEQAQLQELDGRADLYSLGVVIYEMLTGRRPFNAASTREVINLHLKAEVPDPCALRPEIPRELSRLLLHCLEKRPSWRFQTARDLRLALQAAAGKKKDSKSPSRGASVQLDIFGIDLTPPHGESRHRASRARPPKKTAI